MPAFWSSSKTSPMISPWVQRTASSSAGSSSSSTTAAPDPSTPRASFGSTARPSRAASGWTVWRQRSVGLERTRPSG